MGFDVSHDHVVDIVDFGIIAGAFTAIVGAVTLFFGKVIPWTWRKAKDVRKATRAKYAHGVVEAIQPALTEVRTQVQVQGEKIDTVVTTVGALNTRLRQHLDEEGRDISEIRSDITSLRESQTTLVDLEEKIKEMVQVVQSEGTTDH